MKSGLYVLVLLWRSGTVCCGEGVVAQWCDPMTLKPEQSGGVGSRCDRASPLERHDNGSRTQFALSCFCDPSAWRWKPQLHLYHVLSTWVRLHPFNPSCLPQPRIFEQELVQCIIHLFSAASSQIYVHAVASVKKWKDGMWAMWKMPSRNGTYSRVFFK